MRRLLLPLVLALAAAPAAHGQGLLLRLRCTDGCAAGDDRPRTRAVAPDSALVSAVLEARHPRTYATFSFPGGFPGTGTVDGAFVFPLPPGARLDHVSVRVERELVHYNEWADAADAARVLEEAIRFGGPAGLAAYRGEGLVYAPIHGVAAGRRIEIQVGYVHDLPADGDGHRYRYPLATTAAVAPVGALHFVATLRHDHGFARLDSPSHDVRVTLGSESGPCPPRARCGTMGYTSERARVVRLTGGRELQRRDLELRWAYGPHPLPPPGPRPLVEN